MDSKDVEDAVQNLKKKFDHGAAKQILKEKYEAKMLFAAFDGMWKAGPDLLSLTLTFSPQTDVVLLDEYSNPCKVNPSELHSLVAERWQEQMNGWYQEFQEMQKQR